MQLSETGAWCKALLASLHLISSDCAYEKDRPSLRGIHAEEARWSLVVRDRGDRSGRERDTQSEE